ncbi:MAG: cupin domain-containing protein [Bacteroidota bacterium]
MEISTVNLGQKLNAFAEHWSPKIIGELNGQHVKVAKLKGEFVMHHHEHEDELFLVLEGVLFMELEDQTLEIHPGEFVIIPKGVSHKPVAPEEVSVLLFEPASTLNTGNEVNEHTVLNPEKL